MHRNAITTHGEYLHWDKLRFKKPVNELSAEENWFLVKMTRLATRKSVAFAPIGGAVSQFYFTQPDCLLALLRKIDLRSGGTVHSAGTPMTKNDAQRYLQRSLLEEPFSSSVLEGAVTTRERAKELIASGKSPSTKDDRMVINNYNAMNFIKSLRDVDLTPDIILELQSIITQGTLDRSEMSGKLRDNNAVVVGDDFGNDYHVPPDYKELEERLQRICNFANVKPSDDEPFLHPILQAIIVHFMLAYDHPFVDGNGRTARALFYWSVIKSGYWILEYVSISNIIKEAPNKYGEAFLATETDDNDLTYFLMHQLKVIEKSLVRLSEYTERQKTKVKKFEKSLGSDVELNHRQKYLLNELFRRRRISTTIKLHESENKVSYVTARKDLEGLLNEGWLKKTTVNREGLYLVGPRIDDLR